MLPSASSVVRVSRRRSVTMLPFVDTVHSVNVRETLPLSLVTTVAALVFADVSPRSSFLPQALIMPSAMTAPTAPATSIFLFFMSVSFLSWSGRGPFPARRRR